MTDEKQPRAEGDDPGFVGEATPALLPAARTPPHDAPLWAWIAFVEHRRTLGGQRDRARLANYFAACEIGVGPDAYGDAPRWGSAFLCWCMEQAGLRSPRHVSARTWLHWGQPIMLPRYGAPAVYWIEDPKGLSARCGFWVGSARDWDYCIGGDIHTPGPTVTRYPRGTLLGYRWAE